MAPEMNIFLEYEYIEMGLILGPETEVFLPISGTVVETFILLLFLSKKHRQKILFS